MEVHYRPVIYFDHNATTPLHPLAKTAWLEAVDNFPGNPSSPHRLGARAEGALTEARERLARHLHCSPLDIVWTSGATESNNTVFHHFARKLAPAVEIWVSGIEHPSVLEAVRQCFPSGLRLIPVGRSGVVQLDWLAEQLKLRRPGLVAIMAANNETGVLQPWRQALALCRDRQVPFFCDAVQWIGKLPAAGLGDCDFVSGSAHKFGGPKGIGFLKVPRGPALEPFLYGGPQEEGRRAGTENVASVLAMVAMIDAREKALAAGEAETRAQTQGAFEAALIERLPGSVVVGAGQPRLWNTVSALMPERDCRQRWVVKLDKLGFAVSTGSACASGQEAPSHVLTAMGYSGAEAGRALRFSSGWESSEPEWEQLLQALQQVNAAMAGAGR